MVEAVLTSLAVMLRIFSNPLGNVFQKQLTLQGKHPLFVNFITYAALALFCLFIMPGVRVSQLPWQFWLYSVLGGIAGTTGNGFLVKALQKGDLSVLGPVNSYKSVVGIIIALIFLGELPNSWCLLGIALIIYGSYFILDTGKDPFSWALFKRQDIQYRLWAVILTAVEAVFIKKIILLSSTTIAFISWCWFGTLFTFLLLLQSGAGIQQQLDKPFMKNSGKYLYLVICIGTMQFTTIYVFNHMPVGYALSLFQLSTLISVLLGYRIFKEENIRKKLVGAVIMIGGSVFIFLFKNR